MKKNLILYIAVIFAIVILDQWTKHLVSANFYLGESVKVIDGLLNFTYARNTGAAFSFGGNFDVGQKWRFQPKITPRAVTLPTKIFGVYVFLLRIFL